jgi:hypothetical protein
MDREELAALRDAIDVLLRCPDSVREQLMKWFSPKAAKPGNRLDSHPLPIAPTPYVGKSKRGRPQTSTKSAERKLLAAMADNPGLSVVALANAAGSSRSATGERLRQMALRGMVEKDLTGRWKLKSEEPHLPGPQQPSPS